MAKKDCIEILKNSSLGLDIHKYLEEKTGVYDGSENSKKAYIKAAKELQEHSLNTIHNIFAEVGVSGYKKLPTTEIGKTEIKPTIEEPAPVSTVVSDNENDPFNDKWVGDRIKKEENFFGSKGKMNVLRTKPNEITESLNEQQKTELVNAYDNEMERLKGNPFANESAIRKATDYLKTLAPSLSKYFERQTRGLEPFESQLEQSIKDIKNESKPITNKEVQPSIENKVEGKSIEPHKEVKANKAIAQKEISDKYGLKPMEAGMLYNLKDKNIEDELYLAEGLKKQIYDKLDDKGFFGYDDNGKRILDEKAQEYIDKVDARFQTRKNVKSGVDLFPEDANIPEFIAIKKELNKHIDENTINNFEQRTADEVAKSEPIIADIESKAEGNNETELNEAIQKADELISKTETQPSIENKPSIAEKGKDLADRIRQLKTKHDKLQTNIFGIPIAVYDGAIESVATAVENGAKLAEAIQSIIKDIRDTHVGFQEDDFIKHIEDFAAGEKPKIRVQVGEEAKSKTPPIEPPKPPNGNINEGESSGKNELKDMALNIPNEGQLREYASKGTIEKYHGETPENEQGIIVQELTPALQHGENMIAKAKEVFGEKDYVNKTLQFIEESKVPVRAKALMHISLENDLARQKMNNPESLDIQKKQDLVRSKSQAFLREASLAINFGKLRKIGEVGYDISKITDNFFSSKEREEKTTVEKSIEADANIINKEAEVKEAEEVELQQKINDAVESEINKIHDTLSPIKKRNADKAIEALEKFQQKIRSKTYDATIGIPVAIVDAGITIIKHAIKAGVKIADAIDLGIQHIKEKYGKEWVKEGEFKSDMIEGFRTEGIKKEASGTASQIIKTALIESGFGREIIVTTKKGKEKREILDWKKLAGAEGSVDRMKENVSNVLEKRGFDKSEITDIQKDLTEQYNDLRASVIEHSITELNKRNQKTVTPEQKSAAKKLSELYNYGLFEKDPVEYDVLLSKAIGIDKLSPERFKKAHELGKALEILYSSKFNGRKLNDLQLKTAIQSIEEKMRILLHDEAQGHGSTALKLADITRTYMDATQRMILNSLGQAVQNPLSGFEQTLISNIDRLFDNSSTKEMRAQKRKVAISVYKDMVLSGGVNYGDVNTQFVSRGNLDAYINKMSDSKLFHAIASTAIGKTTLDASDSFYKAKLTEQKFTHNLIKVLTQKRLVGDKLVDGMSKEEAVNYVSEKLTGQSFEAAKATAKEIIGKVNSGGKIVNDSEAYVTRLANDIVKAALINGNVITTEQVTAAYNSAYMSAGRSLGHVANNPISDAVQGASGRIEKKIDDAIKNKEYRKAALLTYQSIFFRNILNPFVGGGTNWVVLKLEKNGLGLASGLYNGGKTKLDLTSEAGLKDVEKALYEEARDRDAFMRGAIGGTTALLTAMLWFGVANTDDYRKWRNKNKWATKYLDNITPEAALATMAARNKELLYYGGTLVNKNVNYDKGLKTLKGIDKSGRGKTGEALGQFGEVVGSSFGIPVPWRLARDAQNVWLGANGKEPYKVSSTKSKGFWEGAFKAGMVDYIKNNPLNKK